MVIAEQSWDHVGSGLAMLRFPAHRIIALLVTTVACACNAGGDGGSGSGSGSGDTSVDTSGGDSTADGADTTGGADDGDCPGSALTLGVPDCDAPPGKTNPCVPPEVEESTAVMQVTAPVITFPEPDTQEAEIAAAFVPGINGTEYVATIVIEWASRPVGEEPPFCILQKGIRVYSRDVGDLDFTLVTVTDAGGENLDTEPDTEPLHWFTDPYWRWGPTPAPSICRS
jgi:hypothetical protein